MATLSSTPTWATTAPAQHHDDALAPSDSVEDYAEDDEDQDDDFTWVDEKGAQATDDDDLSDLVDDTEDALAAAALTAADIPDSGLGAEQEPDDRVVLEPKDDGEDLETVATNYLAVTETQTAASTIVAASPGAAGVTSVTDHLAPALPTAKEIGRAHV